MPGPEPQLLAMLFCDDVTQDPQTRMHSVLGIFDAIYHSQFPATHPLLWVYVRVIDAEGKYDFRLDFVNLNGEDEEVLEQDVARNVQISDRLRTHEMIFRLSSVRLPEEGRYEFRLYANDKFIGNQSLVALVRPAQPKEGG